jgi:regulator of replication initiation timing
VVENQGLELGATAKNHQEKIEELFLHLIEMEKRIKTLEAENAQLKIELHHLKQ